MERLDSLKQRLDALRPFSPAQVALLRPLLAQQDALFVYATNAVEGSTLTLGETVEVLQHGVTIGGKTLTEHLDAVHGQKAYQMMLDFAQGSVRLTARMILELHEAVVGPEETFGGRLRQQAVYIRGARHVPPNWEKVSSLFDEMMERFNNNVEAAHPLVASSVLHFDLLTIHPFVDGNGRTARLVHNLHLIQNGYAPILIGNEGNRRAEYFDALSRTQMAGEPGKGDPGEFIELMLKWEELALQEYLKALETAHG